MFLLFSVKLNTTSTASGCRDLKQKHRSEYLSCYFGGLVQSQW